MASSKKSRVKRNRRILVFGLLSFFISGALIYSLVDIWSQIYAKNIEKEQLNLELSQLQEDEQDLKSTVEKLKDPDYLARYARERYLYSGKGEYILNIK